MDAGFIAVSIYLRKERGLRDSQKPDKQAKPPSSVEETMALNAASSWLVHHIKESLGYSERCYAISKSGGWGSDPKGGNHPCTDTHFYSKYLYQTSALDKSYPHTLCFSQKGRRLRTPHNRPTPAVSLLDSGRW